MPRRAKSFYFNDLRRFFCRTPHPTAPLLCLVLPQCAVIRRGLWQGIVVRGSWGGLTRPLGFAGRRSRLQVGGRCLIVQFEVRVDVAGQLQLGRRASTDRQVPELTNLPSLQTDLP